jgi:hypothetical protein
MSVAIAFPQLSIDRRSMPLVRTPLPRVDARTARGLSERLGIGGDVRETGAFVIVQDERSALEVYRASGSLRWAREGGASETDGVGSDLLDDDAATDVALGFLREHQLDHELARVSSVTSVEVLAGGQREEPVLTTVARQVNLRFTFEELPVFGSGAKIQVVVGDKGEVTGFYRFWRDSASESDVRLLPVDRAAELLQQDSAYAELQEEDARVVVENVDLGYLALPPQEAQGYLIPVYAFRGAVSTSVLERYEFTRYVVAAADVSPERIKSLGVVHRSGDIVL